MRYKLSTLFLVVAYVAVFLWSANLHTFKAAPQPFWPSTIKWEWHPWWFHIYMIEDGVIIHDNIRNFTLDEFAFFMFCIWMLPLLVMFAMDHCPYDHERIKQWDTKRK